MLADNSGSHSFAACAPFCGWHAPPPPPLRPLTLAKLNGVCLWIFEELANYCAWCQYNVTQLIYTRLHVQYIDFFFITGNNSNFCTFENRIDIISLASPPLIPGREQGLESTPTRTRSCLAKCNSFCVF